MKPYRPIDLDKLDEEFFSSAKEKSDHEPEEKKIFTDTDEIGGKEFSPVHPSLTPDVIEGLMNVRISNDGPVFHSLPDDPPSQKTTGEIIHRDSEAIAPSKRKPRVSEEEALKSFPDFDFDPSVFEAGENENPKEEPAVDNKEIIKEYKAKAKQEIKEERERIKAQSQLEKKVQKPFKSRKALIFIMILFIIIGLLAASASVIIYLTGSTPQTAFSVQNYSLCYVDGVNIVSSEVTDTLVLISHEKVNSNKMILYSDGELTRLETIVALGADICAVNFENSIHPVEYHKIDGFVVFSLSGVGDIYSFIHTQTATVIIAVAAYFSAVFLIFGILLMIKGKKIKSYRESYQLVS